MRILIVEDEIKLAKAIKRVLELRSYAVDLADNGESGLDMAVAEEYDLIILDLMLPKIDGLEVCSRLRQEKIATPVLMLTAKGQIRDKISGLDLGADDYMVKPFSFEELLARIRSLVRRAHKNPELILKAGDLELNPSTFKVKRGERAIDLSAKEFAILEYLLRQKNQVMSRERIVSHVWDYNANVLPTTVEVHIKNLRDKIDAPFNSKLIRTVRGFGYEIRDGG